MWHKVASLAADQRQTSSSRLSAFRKNEFRKWERGRGRGREGGITCSEMSAVVAKTRASADHHHQAEGRHFGLQSVEFFFKPPGSRGHPAQLLNTAAPVPAFTSRKHRSRLDAQRSREKRVSNETDCPLPNLLPSQRGNQAPSPNLSGRPSIFKGAFNFDKSALASQLKKPNEEKSTRLHQESRVRRRI